MSKIKTTIIKNKQVALGYCRVSTDDQADLGLSLDYQEEQCRKSAKEDGFSEIIIIRDEGKSGKNLLRKGIQEVIDLVKRKEISAVYVTNSDRLARDIASHAFLRTTFADNSVSLKYLNGQSSKEDACSIMADNMFASVNQYHVDITREKTRQATDAKAYAGYFPTHAPVGYLNCVNPDKNCEKLARKIILPNPKTSHLITEMFKLYATGQYNVYELNDLLYEKGLVNNSGKKIATCILYRMLKNRLYLGEIHWQNIHNKNGKHEPLIDEQTFNQVQSIMDGKGGNRCRRRKYFWLLNGYIFCPVHNCRYTAEWHLKKSIAYYHCSNRGGCGKYVEKTDLESQVADRLKNLEFDKEFVNSIITKVKSIFESRRIEYMSKHRAFLNQKNALEAKLRTVEDRLLDETLSRSDYTRIRDEVRTTVGKIDSNIDKLRETNEIDVDVVSEILNLTENIYNVFIEAPETLQKKIIDFFFDGFDVKDGVIIKEHYSPLFKELMDLTVIIRKSPFSNITLDSTTDSKVILSTHLGD